jgi:hypothetical protein
MSVDLASGSRDALKWNYQGPLRRGVVVSFPDLVIDQLLHHRRPE